jgi:hypothetical protein
MTTAPFSLENRSCTVTVGTTQIANIGQQAGLDVWFSVRRSLRPKEPNTCDLRLYNLKEDTRKAIEQASQPLPSAASAPGSKAKVVPVKIEAGYVDHTETIFLGEMRSAQTVTDGPDIVTELTTGDGDEAALLARSTSTFGPGANAYAVAQALIKDMGCGVGNIATVADVLRGAPLFSKGVSLKGNSLAHLVDIASACGLEVNVQGGVTQWTSRGQPLKGEAYSLSSDTGLIGSASVDTKGVLTFLMFMAPGIRPGAPVMLDSVYVKGLFRIISVETTGDTASNDWFHQVEAKKYGLGVS